VVVVVGVVALVVVVVVVVVVTEEILVPGLLSKHGSDGIVLANQRLRVIREYWDQTMTVQVLLDKTSSGRGRKVELIKGVDVHFWIYVVGEYEGVHRMCAAGANTIPCNLICYVCTCWESGGNSLRVDQWS